MGNSFRTQPLPTQYPALRTPVTEDVLQIGLIYAFGIVAVSFILIIPGIRSWEVRKLGVSCLLHIQYFLMHDCSHLKFFIYLFIYYPQYNN